MALFTAGQILTAAQMNALATWEAWVPFTPTWGNVTLGSGATNTARYHRTGRKITAGYQLILGTGGSVTGNILLPLPVAAVDTTLPHIGTALGLQGSTRRGAGVDLNSTTQAIIIQDDSGAIWAASAPFTWAAGNALRAEITYEAAS